MLYQKPCGILSDYAICESGSDNDVIISWENNNLLKTHTSLYVTNLTSMFLISALYILEVLESVTFVVLSNPWLKNVCDTISLV